ncbi:MAG: nucleoside monophosphate kinase [Candidatus Pacebacteria bacterium]|nr:nucleoside monophosphate kinase [Candidatus Paceibacterota bacterium]
MEKQAYIFIGRSGCGKGTQVDLLMDFLRKDPNKKILEVETGSQFREFINGEDYSNKIAKEIGSQGKLQPMFLTVWIWAASLVENLKGGEDLIFDGTPRKKDEADVLDSVFGFYDYEKPKIIYINVSREWATERLLARKEKEGRKDDEIEKINIRQDWFDTDVMETIDWYKANSNYKFLDIKGEQSIEDVHQEIMNKLGE